MQTHSKHGGLRKESFKGRVAIYQSAQPDRSPHHMPAHLWDRAHGGHVSLQKQTRQTKTQILMETYIYGTDNDQRNGIHSFELLIIINSIQVIQIHSQIRSL